VEVSISGCGIAAGFLATAQPSCSHSSAILQPQVPMATGQGTSIRASAPYTKPYMEELSKLLEFKRALYGLKDAYLLWYKHLKEMLIKLGLRPVKDILCFFTNEKLIVFSMLVILWY
jgi:hypothetical protein